MKLIPQEDLEALLRLLYAEAPAKPQAKNGSAHSGTLFKAEKDGYVFPALSDFGDITLTKGLISKGIEKSQEDWWKNKKLIVPNTRIWFQCLNRIYDLRNDSEYVSLLKPCLNGLRKNFDNYYLHTGTKIKYEAYPKATIYNLQLDGSVVSQTLEIPEFTLHEHDKNWSYLILSQERSESELENIEFIPDNAKPVLDVLLGKGYEKAGSVFSYIASRKEGNLREIRLWVPSAKNRNIERAVVLGVDDCVGFVLGGGVGLWPSRGVVRRRES